jgi:hypothetical protein
MNTSLRSNGSNLRKAGLWPTTRSGRAFSLLEIMVAVALLAVIIVGLLAMFYQVQRAFRAGTAQVDVMEGGRSTMSALTRELQGMTAADVDFVTNFTVVPSINVLPTIQELPSREVRQNFLEDLCFLSRVNSDQWSATAYRFSNALSGVGTLYRLVERTNRLSLPVDSQNALSNIALVAGQTTPYNNPTNYRRVLDGVVSFTVIPYDSTGHAYTNADNSSLFIDNNFGVYLFKVDALPAYLDIELAVLEPSIVDKFHARIDNTLAYPESIRRATNYLARQIGRTHVFRQKVPIRPLATRFTSTVP